MSHGRHSVCLETPSGGKVIFIFPRESFVVLVLPGHISVEQALADCKTVYCLDESGQFELAFEIRAGRIGPVNSAGPLRF